MLENQTIKTPVLIEDLGMLFPKEDSKLKRRFGLFKCQCGVEFKTTHQKVKSSHTKTCGCLSKKIIIARNYKHGMFGTRLYWTWHNMIQRCEYEKHQYYNIYGGRGISVCNEWRNAFMSFYDWAINNGYDDNKEIDRINNDLNYHPDNCRFVSEFVQSQNTRLLQINNTSGYRGVTFIKISKKWYAYITSYGKRISLGYHKSALEAAKAYDSYVIDNNLDHTINWV